MARWTPFGAVPGEAFSAAPPGWLGAPLGAQASLLRKLTQTYIFLCPLNLRDSAARFPPFDSLRLGSQVRALGRLSKAVRSCPASAC